jgi:hypothetical protein
VTSESRNQARCRRRRLRDSPQERLTIGAPECHALVLLEDAPRALVREIAGGKSRHDGGPLDQLANGWRNA